MTKVGKMLFTTVGVGFVTSTLAQVGYASGYGYASGSGYPACQSWCDYESYCSWYPSSCGGCSMCDAGSGSSTQSGYSPYSYGSGSDAGSGPSTGSGYPSGAETGCESWCDYESYCSWYPGSCGGCSMCDAGSGPSTGSGYASGAETACESWCHTRDCGWYPGSCGGCSMCDPGSGASSGCESWCEYESYCSWFPSSCGGCSMCDAGSGSSTQSGYSPYSYGSGNDAGSGPSTGSGYASGAEIGCESWCTNESYCSWYPGGCGGCSMCDYTPCNALDKKSKCTAQDGCVWNGKTTPGKYCVADNADCGDYNLRSSCESNFHCIYDDGKCKYSEFVKFNIANCDHLELTEGGNCVGTKVYGDNHYCEITVLGDFDLDVRNWDVEDHYYCSYDYLKLPSGAKFCTNSPQGESMSNGDKLEWFTDYSITRGGWKICATGSGYGDEEIMAPPHPEESELVAPDAQL